jgi:hypothetical protein
MRCDPQDNGVIDLSCPGIPPINTGIKPGEVRIATGKVSAIDPASRALVMESPTSKGMMSGGVTRKEGASIMKKSRAISLGDLKAGETVTLRYLRENGRLIGMNVKAR